MKLAISGASGKTGYRIAEEALKRGHSVKLLLRTNSVVPDTLKNCEQISLSLQNKKALDEALKDADCLFIATGARPSIDLTGPARVDALGVKQQVDSCKRVSLKRIVLVSSLCSGKLCHPLNLFGLILIWKRLGEKLLEESGFDWTIIRPGGLTEDEHNVHKQRIYYSAKNTQEEGSIPRRLVAKTCLEALETKESIKKIIEITSSEKFPQINLNKAISQF